MVDLPNIGISKKIEFISRISKKGGSWYILIPSRYARKLQLRDNDDVLVVVAKLQLIRGDEDEG